ncbi:hypothetical protein NHQ30_002912 [Ciborinia camelliae]|nr:hypothetical protein NHQ30_002912 [Ciborinia camelliae]
MNNMEVSSSSSIDDGHTQDTHAGWAQATSSSATQESTIFQYSADGIQTTPQSEAENLHRDRASGAIIGVPNTIDTIPDPYVVSQIASRYLKPNASTSGSSNDANQGDSSSEGTQAVANFETFTRFSELPIEIQRMIWKRALPGPRVFLIKPILRKGPWNTWPSGTYNTYKSNYIMPGMILVWKETSEMVSKESVVMRNTFVCRDVPGQCFQNKIVFNFKIDPIYIDANDPPLLLDEMLHDRILSEILPGIDYGEPRILHLAIPAPERLAGPEFVRFVKRFLLRHPCVRHLSFVLADYTRRVPLEKREVVFEDPVDIHYALEFFERDPRKTYCNEVPNYPFENEEFLKRAIANLEDLPVRVNRPNGKPFVIPEDVVVDFKIVVKREIAEELARRKKRFYALKELIAQETDVS